MAPTKNKTLTTLTGCRKLLTLIEQGEARIIKEFKDGTPVLVVVSASGAPIGVVASKYGYLFEPALLERGSGDGLFEGFSQTTIPPLA
jgi:hypothetical protein